MSQSEKLRIHGRATLWIIIPIVCIQFVNSTFCNDTLYQYGYIPRDLSSLSGVIFSPWIHYDWGHCLTNVLALYLIGGLLADWSRRLYVINTVLGIFLPSALWWLLSPDGGSPHVGASLIGMWYCGVFYASWICNIKTATKGMSRFMLVLLCIIIAENLMYLALGNMVDWSGHIFSMVLSTLTSLVCLRKQTALAWQNYTLVSK